MSEIQKKIASIQAEIEVLRATDTPVRLVAVTKGQSPESIQEAIGFGICDLAVNYVQEGEKIRSVIQKSGLAWHFIGHIQSRKVKALVEYQMIQSMDRLLLAEELDLRLKQKRLQIDLLIEVNIGSEAQKSGILGSELGSFLESLAKLTSIRARGIMVMPPALENLEERRPFFRQAKALFEKYRGEFALDTLSMGTSEDYRIALQEGSNMVRLGTALFGARNYK